MNRPLSTPPPTDPPDSIEPSEEYARTIPAGWSLSKAQAEELIASMRGMIWEVGCPVHLHLDVVQDAFVVALSKPISERPPITNWIRFVSWMCTVAKYSALTNRNTERRRRESDALSDEEIFELLAVPEQEKDFLALEALGKACMKLEPEQQALIKAHYIEGKTIKELADKQGVAWTTMKSRVDRVHDLLRRALRSLIAAILVLVTKNARAQGARLARRVSYLVPQATQTVCAMTVTVACGVMVPASSTAMTVHQDALTSALLAPSDTNIAPATMPRLPVEVAPVKRIALDEPDEQWSASPMSSTKIASYLQATVLPFAFLVAPAMTQVACAGAAQHTPPPQQPEDDDEGNTGGMDPYDAMCLQEQRRGNDCVSKTEWYRSMGFCPDGKTKGCK